MSTIQIRRWDDLSAEQVRALPLGAVCVIDDGRHFERVQTASGPMWCEFGRLVHTPPPPCATVQIPVVEVPEGCTCQYPPPYPGAEGCWGVRVDCPIHGDEEPEEDEPVQPWRAECGCVLPEEESTLGCSRLTALSYLPADHPAHAEEEEGGDWTETSWWNGEHCRCACHPPDEDSERSVVVPLTDGMIVAINEVREAGEVDAQVLVRGIGALVREQARDLPVIPFVEIRQSSASLLELSVDWFKRIVPVRYAACTCADNEVSPTGRALGASVSFYCPEHGHTRR